MKVIFNRSSGYILLEYIVSLTVLLLTIPPAAGMAVKSSSLLSKNITLMFCRQAAENKAFEAFYTKSALKSEEDILFFNRKEYRLKQTVTPAIISDHLIKVKISVKGKNIGDACEITLYKKI